MSFRTTASKFSKRSARRQTLSLLICGGPGTGKSSFINTFFGQEVISTSSSAQLHNLYFNPLTLELDEPLDDGSKVLLTLTETEGFGFNINHAQDIDDLAQYIECKFDEVLSEESRIRRNPKFKDGRIDACLYFIEPTGHGLKELDILALKRLSPIVNIIPVLARSDTLTLPERLLNRRLINEDFQAYDIDIFDFQFDDENENDGLHDDDVDILSSVPFAITSSSEFKPDGSVLYIRKHAFGVVDILNSEHCDFKLMKDAILNGFLTELKERTHYTLYETYRTHRLDPQQNHRSSLLLPQELADHAAKLKGAQLQREAARLKEEDARILAELEAKKQLILKREKELLELETKISASSKEPPQPVKSTVESTVETGPEGAVIKETRETQTQTQINPENLHQNADQNAEPLREMTVEVETETKELHLKQSASRKELNKLHAELGDLEQKRDDIHKRQLANSEPNSAEAARANFASSMHNLEENNVVPLNLKNHE